MKTQAKPDLEWYRYTGPLRDTHGRPPLGCPWNRHWALGMQGELHHHPGYGRGVGVGLEYSIALLELNNGRWIARPDRRSQVPWHVDAHQYEDRVSALRGAVASVLRKARNAVRRPRSFTPYDSLTPEQAATVMRWALGLLGEDAPRRVAVPTPPPPPAPLVAVAPAGTPQLALFGEAVAR